MVCLFQKAILAEVMVNQACHRNEISDTKGGNIGVSGKDKPLEAGDCPVTCSSTAFYVQVYSDCTVIVQLMC